MVVQEVEVSVEVVVVLTEEDGEEEEVMDAEEEQEAWIGMEAMEGMGERGKGGERGGARRSPPLPTCSPPPHHVRCGLQTINGSAAVWRDVSRRTCFVNINNQQTA